MQSTLEEKGMTLIEVILALGILLLLATYFLTSITTSNTWISRAGKTTQAVNVASAVMEDIRLNVNSVNVGTYAGTMLNFSAQDGGLDLTSDYNKLLAGQEFYIEVIIQEVYLKDGIITEIRPHMTSDLLQILVQVSWQENKQDYREELMALISRR